MDEQPPQDPQPQSQHPVQPASSGFDLNHPTIISGLYLLGYFTGITGLIGVVLAYVWKGEPHAEWETSHYQYLIRTFWIGFGGLVLGIILTIVLIGIFLILAVSVWMIVRSVMSLIKAQKQEPMPDPETWLF
jgi:uncharacterized membrane protein